MRLGAAWARERQGFYRARLPLEALEQRGHEVIWPSSDSGEIDLDRLSRCDVVHVHRCFDAETRVVLEELARRGVVFTWDSGDDCVPAADVSGRASAEALCGVAAGEGQAGTLGLGGPWPAGRLFEHALRVARRAQVVTVPNEMLARSYRESGIERVEVIPDCVAAKPRQRRRHDGLVIGWVVDEEADGDDPQREVAAVLGQIQQAHDDVRIELLGGGVLGLGRGSEVPTGELPQRLAGFDLAVAPLADTARNRSRSDIVVKEYAAAGIPWLASSCEAYGHLGQAEGGRLVSEHDWFDALDGLLRDPAARRRLAARGRRWGKVQTVDRVAERWEAVFEEAAEQAVHEA